MAADRRSEEWNKFVRRYENAILSFAAHHGFTANDGKDIAQIVFEKLWTGTAIDRAKKSKGMFRNLIMGVTLNAIKEWIRRNRAQRRDSTRLLLISDVAAKYSLDEYSITDEKARSVEESFLKAWVENLLQRSVVQLKEECDAGGFKHYDVFRQKYLEGEETAEFAAKLGLSREEAENQRRTSLRHFRRVFCDLVRLYCKDDAEAERELRNLSGMLSNISDLSI